ncbi:class II fructose-bisphosphate aldolase [candidate division KSB1 bacterium]|nr:class II fructose-bisphosphate aldolase [candidate division KSB1 bacterium]
MQISTAQLFHQAYGTFAIGAFNVFTMEQVLGLFKGAAESAAPIIVAVTPVARRYASPGMMAAMVKAASNLYPDVVFAVHLDHGDRNHCADAIESGDYHSVMIDASYETFDKNIAFTSEIVRKAHAVSMHVEAELGLLSGIEDDVNIADKQALYTDPEQALEFVQRTQCDSLAVAVGTSHGAYKFSGGSGLRLEILQQIGKKLPGFPLVLHGASAVPHDEIERINAAGGALKSSAQGANPDELQRAISLGVCKINIATDARLIWTRVHREFFRDHPDKFDPIVPGQHYMSDYAEFVGVKCQLLGANGKARLFT